MMRRPALARIAAVTAAIVVALLLAFGVRHIVKAQAAQAAQAAGPSPTPTVARHLPPNLDGLQRALAAHRTVSVVGIGSSVGAGAELPEPATESPVGHLTALLEQRYPHAAFTTENLSVNGSTTFDGLTVYTDQVRPLHPTVLLIAFGMNDGQTAQFNSGETLPGSIGALRQIVETAREDGTTVLVATTPSPDTDGNDPAMPAGLPVNYPVPGGALEPTVADSVTTIDGQPFSARHAIWNGEARKLADQLGATLVDAAATWPAAVAAHGQAGLFNVQHGPSDAGRFVHPNLLGHRSSYWAAEADFVDRLPAPPAASSAPTSVPAG